MIKGVAIGCAPGAVARSDGGDLMALWLCPEKLPVWPGAVIALRSSIRVSERGPRSQRPADESTVSSLGSTS
jgi:hypothetical protein